MQFDIHVALYTNAVLYVYVTLQINGALYTNSILYINGALHIILTLQSQRHIFHNTQSSSQDRNTPAPLTLPHNP
jgi:hypothetical protein